MAAQVVSGFGSSVVEAGTEEGRLMFSVMHQQQQQQQQQHRDQEDSRGRFNANELLNLM
jgi:hypothetical protein